MLSRHAYSVRQQVFRPRTDAAHLARWKGPGKSWSFISNGSGCAITSASAMRTASVWDDDKALRAIIQRYCPLPWMPMDGFGQRGGYRQLRRMYGPPRHGEGKEEQTVTRGLFLRADADMNWETLTLIWRRVMGVLCGRYPAWQLDSFDCPNEKTEPEGRVYVPRIYAMARWGTLHTLRPGIWLRGRGRARDCLRLRGLPSRRLPLRGAVLGRGILSGSTARTKPCLRRCTATRNCGRCVTGLKLSPTKTTGGRRFVSEAIFPAPVLTGRAPFAIIKHTVRQSHSCGAPELRFS